MFWNNHSKKQIKYFLLSEDAVCFIKNYAMPAMKLHFPIDDATLSAIVDFATQWEIDAKADHEGTRLTFDSPDGWSLKYNIVWDSLLGYNIFSDEVKKNEIKVYMSKMNRYGVPLDSRSDYTKIDWLMWSTCIFKDKEYFNKVCECMVNMVNETLDRVPLTDWYYTSTADYRAFRNRTVVGGLFINLLD